MKTIFSNPNFIDSNTTESDVHSMFDIVRKCPYIASNPDYKEKAALTKIFFNQEPVVNAYATVRTEDPLSYKIVIYKGICDSLKMGSLAMAEYSTTKDLQKFVSVLKWLGKSIVENRGQFDDNTFREGLQSTGLDLSDNNCREAKAYFAGSLIDLIGHEIGHVISGHVLREDTGNANSRNDERIADLFACAVAESSPFTRYAVFGGLVMCIIFTWCSGIEQIETTHPHSRERVYNLIAAHREYLSTLGISDKNIDQFLP